MRTSTGPNSHSVKSRSYKVCLPETHMDIRTLPVLFWAPRKSCKNPLYCFLSYKPMRKWKEMLVLNSMPTFPLRWTQILSETFSLPYSLRKVNSSIFMCVYIHTCAHAWGSCSCHGLNVFLQEQLQGVSSVLLLWESQGITWVIRLHSRYQRDPQRHLSLVLGLFF